MPEAGFAALLEAFHFVRPEWLAAVPAALLLAWHWARRGNRRSRWEDRIDPLLLGALLEDRQVGSARLLPWLLASALSVGAIGLAGPAWERLPQPVEQQSDAVVILLDLSLSMLAEDVQPSRLVRARQKIADILHRRREGFTGLIAYAGNAHTVVPLTDDTRTIENLLPALSPDMMPVFGSDVGAAIDLAHELFQNARINHGLILLVTDGVDQISDATERRDPDFPISVLGVGTTAGGTIPLRFADRAPELLRTQQGEPVIARLDEQRLRDVAGFAHGRYRSLVVGDDDLNDLLGTPTHDSGATRAVDRRFDLWTDRGYWAAVVLIPLLLLGFRRGVFVLVPLLLLPAPADADVWDDLWARRDQQAYRELQEGQPERAAALFEDPDWRAAALYRSGEYARAGEAFAAAATRSPAPRGGGNYAAATALYNLGNALARQGDYRGAIKRYDAVLAQDPEHDDARSNRALMDKLLEEQSRAESTDTPDESRQDGAPDDGSDAPPQDPGATPSARDADAGDGEPGERTEQQADADGEAAPDGTQESDTDLASRDVDRDALEQWLRRVPDDPGGLLRRKFQYETNQRLRQGGFRARDSGKIW